MNDDECQLSVNVELERGESGGKYDMCMTFLRLVVDRWNTQLEGPNNNPPGSSRFHLRPTITDPPQSHPILGLDTPQRKVQTPGAGTVSPQHVPRPCLAPGWNRWYRMVSPNKSPQSQ